MKRGDFKWSEDRSEVIYEEKPDGYWIVDEIPKNISLPVKNSFYYGGIDPYQPRLKWYQKILKWFCLFNNKSKCIVYKRNDDGKLISFRK